MLTLIWRSHVGTLALTLLLLKLLLVLLQPLRDQRKLSAHKHCVARKLRPHERAAVGAAATAGPASPIAIMDVVGGRRVRCVGMRRKTDKMTRPYTAVQPSAASSAIGGALAAAAAAVRGRQRRRAEVNTAAAAATAKEIGAL